MELPNSKRTSATATYVAITLSDEDRERSEREPGRAIDKINFLRDAQITTRDVRRARDALLPVGGFEFLGPVQLREALGELDSVVAQIGDARTDVSNFVLAPQMARIPSNLLIKVAELAVDSSYNPSLATEKAGFLLHKIEMFKSRMKTSPVGRLHLERIEMYPVCMERGELIFTVPLAPAETVTISHKEWSTSSDEYERIIQDYFESYSERGVAEKTDASMSVENESKRASALNFSSSISGGFGPVSASVTFGATSSAEDREALKTTTQRLFEVTEKASSRARQEHKISAKLETKRGVEDSSFRTISNPFTDKAIRVDYYRMMRKWRTDFFRYGLRLTYDITIPNPGARLWALHDQVRRLDQKLAEPFVISVAPTDLTEDDWADIQAQYGVVLDPPPPATIPITLSKTLTSSLDVGANDSFVFLAPDGYSLADTVEGDAMWHGPYQTPPVIFPPGIQHPSTPSGSQLSNGGTMHVSGTIWGSAKQRILPVIIKAITLLINLTVMAIRDPALFADWQNRSWATIRDKAFADFQAEQARLRVKRDELWTALNTKDTLTLRRLEREELIRQTLYWIMGIDLFDPAPDQVSVVIKRLLQYERNDQPDGSPYDDAQKISQTDWALAAGFGDIVKYFHQAVEWENLLYFLYPYFWGSDDLGREKMLFEHPDPLHRDFLRAGYIRIVVPIRPGFEHTFANLVETGSYAGISNAPYMSVAQETEAFARTNYPGIPPAHPEKHARPLLYPEQRQTWETMQKVILLIDAYAAANGGIYPPNLAALSGGPFLDAWGKELDYKLPGSGNDYDLRSLGADGTVGGEDLDADISAASAASLVASWFEYTPSSGIDIEINTAPDKIA